jgi:metacaspase-1
MNRPASLLAGLLLLAAALPAPAETRALLVGIDDYPVRKLTCSVRDVELMKTWLGKLGVPPTNVTTLLNAEATRDAILKHARNLMLGASAQDTVIFYFSGHGTLITDDEGDEADGVDEALCPSDVLPSINVIKDDEIGQLFEGFAGRKLLIVDACHSGTITRSASALAANGVAEHKFLDLGCGQPAARGERQFITKGTEGGAVGWKEASGEGGSLVLCACAPDEVAFEDRERGTSVFTGAWVKVAMSAGPDATFEALREPVSREIQQFFTLRAKAIPAARNRRQSPYYEGALSARVGDFLQARPASFQTTAAPPAQTQPAVAQVSGAGRPPNAPGSPARPRPQANVTVPPSAGPIEVSLATAGGRDQFQFGDFLDLEVRADRDAHLYVVYRDARGKATMLFPNARAKQNRIAANQRLRIPKDFGDAFYVQFEPPSGMEQILAIASETPLGELDAIFRRADEAALYAQAGSGTTTKEILTRGVGLHFGPKPAAPAQPSAAQAPPLPQRIEGSEGWGYAIKRVRVIDPK